MIRTASELTSRIARPARESRWTVLVLHNGDAGAVLTRASRFAAEDATVVLLDEPEATRGLVVLDTAGVVQHLAEDVEDALSALAAFRTGTRRPFGSAVPLR